MSDKQQHGNALWDNFKQIILAVIMALIIKTSVVEAYKIPTASMEDTLLIGDFLLANKFIYGARLPIVNWKLPALREPEPGDVIIFIYPIDGQTKYIKRCVAGPLDTVLVKDKILYVNGELFPQPEFGKYDRNSNGELIIFPRRKGGLDSRDNFGPYVVPENSYFAMGDNRDNSSDSRKWGPVPRQNILGQAMMVHWSWDDTKYPSPEVSVGDPLSVPRSFIHNIIHFVQKARWSRLFGGIS